MLKHFYRVLRIFGFDLKIFLYSIYNTFGFFVDFFKLKKQKGKDNSFTFSRLYPVLNDKNDQGGVMNGHYFHQDLHVARLIFEKKPIRHVDIGSRTDGFVAHVASFRDIEVIDIRTILSKVKNISFRKANLMELQEDLIGYSDSVSCLHAIEHFGLGRYGDPIDYWGYLKGIHNITKIIKSGGHFYFSVPIGPQRIEFNAHRVFSLKYLLDIFKNDFQIISFSYVDDLGEFHENVGLDEKNIDDNFGCTYGCGIFDLLKN
jgi:hypothetical protein